jgi:glucose-1-phosphate thymidylyltransferase
VKVIIPLAGLGKRMRPHTHSKAKPMVRLAGKPILGHLLDWVAGPRVDEVILVVSPHQTDVEPYARSATSVPVRVAIQDNPRGQADAIIRARGHADCPVLVVFSDTLGDATFDHLDTTNADGLIYVKEVPDPSRFGIVIVGDGRITDIVEKPKDAASRLATIGMYYFKSSDALYGAIDRVLAEPPRLNNEYFIADAIKLLVDDGKRLEAHVVDTWEDTGTPEYTLHAHRFLLDQAPPAGPRHAVTIVPPVYIAPDAEVSESVVGPYVTIESGCRVSRSVLRDTILEPDSQVHDSILERAMLGARARVVGIPASPNLSDDSLLGPPSAEPLPEL